MKPKRTIRECTLGGKLTYTEEQARREVENVHRKFRLTMYSCRRCQMWHLKVIQKTRTED